MEKRLKVVLLVYLLCSFALIIRFYYWQIYHRVDLRAMGENQYSTLSQQTANRGVIYSKDGYPLVKNIDQYSLTVDPKSLEISTKELQHLLQPIIGDTFTIKPFDNNSRWVNLASRLSKDTVSLIKKLGIKGLNYEPIQSRYYPEASMSAHLLGFVGNSDSGQPKGYYGLEGNYDRELKGRSIPYTYQKDAVFRPISFSNNQNITLEGRSLITTIDRPLQYQLEKRLKDGIREYQAKSGFGIVLDPSNGSILALAAWPNYDPEKYWEYSPELYRNPVISSTFEPGSIFKVLVMASAVDEAVITVDSICDRCQGPRTIGDYSIKTWNDKYYVNTDMTDILIHSDNVGMVYVAEKLGLKKFYDRYEQMGFSKKTGIDLEGEAVPLVRKYEDWGLIDLATASFGQGIAVTPLQIVRAVNAIASGGVMYQPYVVTEAVENGSHIQYKTNNGVRLFKHQTAKDITAMMVKAVNSGEARWAKPKGYQIAGKTGTAQIPILGHYDPEKTVASFIGFGPANEPRFTMLISLVEPKTSQWGSETAAPLWFRIAGDIFRIWQIPPDS